MKRIKLKFFGFLFIIAHVCHGQFFYTDYQEGKYWIQTNSAMLSSPLVQQNSYWSSYVSDKYKKKNNGHSFGIFGHFRQDNDLLGIFQNSDLIGNGAISTYRYISPHVEIMNSMFFTYDRLEAERGFVRTIKNVTMYTNQAYLRVFNSWKDLDYSIKIGRDFLRVGHGLNANLFLSDFSRPFDQFTLEANLGKLNALFSAIELDTLLEHNRYLYMHSFGYQSERFSITFGESIIATGISKSINIQYLNPFNFWSWENLGSTNKGLNAFLYVGMTWLPRKGLRFYGEAIIDDINFHQKDAFYLNRFGYLLGFQKTGFPLKSSNLWIEYSNVLNQVYQSYHPTHIYTHRGFPIGHYLGNDFNNLRIHYSHLIMSGQMKPFIDISYLLDGSNGLDTLFDNPWENEKGEFFEDYEPPSNPTPPVTKWIELEIGVELNTGYDSYITITGQYQLLQLSSSSSNFGIGIRFWTFFQIPFKHK